MKLFWGFICFLTLVGPAYSASHYVRDEAAGAGNGQNWTDAWEDCGDINWASVNRGDTIYFADGTYSDRLQLNKAASGTSVITLRKACSTGVGDGDHGTETGWDSDWGDETAYFNYTGDSPMEIKGPYVTIDGITGYYDGSTEAYGFWLHSTAGRILSIKWRSGQWETYDGITVKHTKFTTADSGESSIHGIAAWDVHLDNALFEWNYFYRCAGVQYEIWDCDDCVIQYTLADTTVKLGGAHNQGIQLGCDNTGCGGVQPENTVVRYNIWKDIYGTAVLSLSGDNIDVYGNLFMWTQNWESGDTINNGIVGVSNSNPPYFCSNHEIYNNTFVNMRAHFYADEDCASGNVAKNNLFYDTWSGTDDSVKGMVWSSKCTPSYNYYYDAGTHSGETGQQAGESDIFTTYSRWAGLSNDLDLSKATNDGDDTIGSSYNTDGVRKLLDGPDATTYTRGDDGTWDRGAFEYGGASTQKIITGVTLGTGVSIH